MKAFNPYLNFDGNTREAMTFYNACVDGELVIQTFGDVKAPGPPGSYGHAPPGPVLGRAVWYADGQVRRELDVQLRAPKEVLTP